MLMMMTVRKLLTILVYVFSDIFKYTECKVKLSKIYYHMLATLSTGYENKLYRYAKTLNWFRYDYSIGFVATIELYTAAFLCLCPMQSPVTPYLNVYSSYHLSSLFNNRLFVTVS